MDISYFVRSSLQVSRRGYETGFAKASQPLQTGCCSQTESARPVPNLHRHSSSFWFCPLFCPLLHFPMYFALALALCFALQTRAKQKPRARAKFEGKIHGEMKKRAKIQPLSEKIDVDHKKSGTTISLSYFQ